MTVSLLVDFDSVVSVVSKIVDKSLFWSPCSSTSSSESVRTDLGLKVNGVSELEDLGVPGANPLSVPELRLGELGHGVPDEDDVASLKFSSSPKILESQIWSKHLYKLSSMILTRYIFFSILPFLQGRQKSLPSTRHFDRPLLITNFRIYSGSRSKDVDPAIFRNNLKN